MQSKVAIERRSLYNLAVQDIRISVITMLTDFKFTLYQFLILSTLQLLLPPPLMIFLNGKNDFKDSMICCTYF